MEENNQTGLKEEQKGSQKKAIGLLMVEAGMEFAVLIALPLIAGIFAGKWLDGKYHHNFFVIVGILFGIVVSSFAIYKRINELKRLIK